LDVFFKACRKKKLGFEDKVAWMFNRGANGGEAHVTQKAITITVFEVDTREFSLISTLRRAPSENIFHLMNE
jgi:hypothetical protein